MLLPIGLDETRLSRLPWVSIALLAANVAVFALTSFSSAEDEVDARFEEVVSYWSERPHLELPEALSRRYGLDADRLAELTGVRRPAPEDAPLGAAAEQAELDALCDALLEAQDASPYRRFGLVPEKGFAQPGWLSHQFMHGGFGHLFGNMLVFFLVVAPFLEDAWGRPFFLAFYLAGGLVAGLAQALPSLDSAVPIVGASGAISACLGAFALRFAHRRVRIFYWWGLVWRGTFFVPAWGYAFFGLALDLLGLKLQGTSGGVAYGAHVGGFLFGLAVAVAVRSGGLEARFAPEGAVAQGGSLAGSRAAEALADGRAGEAREHFELALRKDPEDAEALRGLARIAAASFDRAGATTHGERLFTRLATRDPAGARALLVELAPVLEAEGFRPPQAYRAAELVAAEAPELADRLDEVAARAGGAVAAKALLRAAIRSRGRDPAAALDRAERAAAVQGAPPEIATRAAALAAELRAVVDGGRDRFAALELPPEEETPQVAPRLTPAPLEVEPPAPRARPPLLDPAAHVKLVHCRIVGADGAALRLATASGTRTLAPDRVAALAAGVVAEHALGGQTRRNAVLLDLLLHPSPGEGGRIVVRVPGHAIALGALHPGVPPQDAFGRVVDALLSASGATAAPSPAAAAGRPFARFPDAAAFERAAWGRALSA